MENKTPKRLFQEMIERKQKMKEAENFILHEEIKFKETVKDAKEELEVNKKEILKLYNTPIEVGADMLVEQIASEWGVYANQLDVEASFVDTIKFGKIGKNKFLKICENESFNGQIKCVLNVQSQYEVIFKEVTFELPINLNGIQKNGEKLISCLDVETFFRGWALYTDLKCSDYKNLIFEFQFDTLVDTSKNEFVPRNKKFELILKAYERECEKEAKNDIPSHDRHKYIQS